MDLETHVWKVAGRFRIGQQKGEKTHVQVESYHEHPGGIRRALTVTDGITLVHDTRTAEEDWTGLLSRKGKLLKRKKGIDIGTVVTASVGHPTTVQGMFVFLDHETDRVKDWIDKLRGQYVGISVSHDWGRLYDPIAPWIEYKVMLNDDNRGSYNALFNKDRVRPLFCGEKKLLLVVRSGVIPKPLQFSIDGYWGLLQPMHHDLMETEVTKYRDARRIYFGEEDESSAMVVVKSMGRDTVPHLWVDKETRSCGSVELPCWKADIEIGDISYGMVQLEGTDSWLVMSKFRISNCFPIKNHGSITKDMKYEMLAKPINTYLNSVRGSP